jgi:hypothetical protein
MNNQIPLFIPLETIDHARALQYWKWILPEEYTPLLLTAFGDWVFGAPDGSIHFLDTLEGQLRKISENVHEFNRLKETTEKKDEWFMEVWVIGMANRGILLKPGECFGFKVHPKIGGKIEFDNMKPFQVVPYEWILGQLHEQISKMMPGSTITGFKLNAKKP